MRKISNAIAILCAFFLTLVCSTAKDAPFPVMETSVRKIHAAYKSGRLTARQLVQMYLDRIQAYDQRGPAINSIITINPEALAEADRLDAAAKKSGFVGPLHGIPILIKDEIDAAGMPTTLGSVVFKDYRPVRDAFVVERLKKAGAIILGKATMAEFARGDTYGSLFGATRNPYALDRTVGGSSGGPAAALAANFSALAIGQETLASIRRPAAWDDLVGLVPTPGLVSRTGVFGGWPSRVGTLGPMGRSTEDVAALLDVMVGYDPEDPVTALGVGKEAGSYTRYLDKNGLQGARIGVLRDSFGTQSDVTSEDFKQVDEVFSAAMRELTNAGATLVDPISIPNLKQLLAARVLDTDEESLKVYLGRNPNGRFKTVQDVEASPDYSKIFPRARLTSGTPSDTRLAQYEKARDELAIQIQKIMADNHLDALVHKSVEHSPGLIADGMKPPYPGMRGTISLNTFLIYSSTITVPAGHTRDDIPVGITFLGRPYSESVMIRLAYAYEQATHHRKPPRAVPALP